MVVCRALHACTGQKYYDISWRRNDTVREIYVSWVVVAKLFIQIICFVFVIFPLNVHKIGEKL